jgi:hypothetical protein
MYFPSYVCCRLIDCRCFDNAVCSVIADLFSIIVFTLSLIVTWKYKLNPFYLLLVAAGVGMLLG